MIVKTATVYGFEDPSVGIFGDVFKITSGDYLFNSENYKTDKEFRGDLEKFRKLIENAFEYVCDTSQIMFDFEEGEYKHAY